MQFPDWLRGTIILWAFVFASLCLFTAIAAVCEAIGLGPGLGLLAFLLLFGIPAFCYVALGS